MTAVVGGSLGDQDTWGPQPEGSSGCVSNPIIVFFGQGVMQAARRSSAASPDRAAGAAAALSVA